MKELYKDNLHNRTDINETIINIVFMTKNILLSLVQTISGYLFSKIKTFSYYQHINR